MPYYGKVPMKILNHRPFLSKYYLAFWYGIIGSHSNDAKCPVAHHAPYGTGQWVMKWLWDHVGLGMHTSGGGQELWWQAIFPFYGVRRVLVLRYWKRLECPTWKNM